MSVDSFNKQGYRDLYEKQLQATTTDIAQIPDSLVRKNAGNPNILYAPYRFESGPLTAVGPIFQTLVGRILRRQGSPVAHVKWKFSAKGNRTLEQSFVHKKSPKELLKTMHTTLTTTT